MLTSVSLCSCKQKAETLRLRLLLANYKVRTGQTDVPLEQLRVVPVPGPHYRHTDPLAPAATTTTTTLPPPSSMVATAGSFSSTSATSSTHSDATETCRQLAPPAPSDLSATPRDGEDDALHKDEQPGKTVPEGNDLPPLYHQPARTPVRRRSGGAYSDSDSDGEEGDDYARWRRARLGNDVEQRRGEAYPRHNHEDDIANSELRGGAVASLLSLKRGAAVVD